MRVFSGVLLSALLLSAISPDAIEDALDLALEAREQRTHCLPRRLRVQLRHNLTLLLQGGRGILGDTHPSR